MINTPTLQSRLHYDAFTNMPNVIKSVAIHVDVSDATNVCQSRTNRATAYINDHINQPDNSMFTARALVKTNNELFELLGGDLHFKISKSS